MNPRLVWHILAKDTRRLWWIIALTLALLVRLAHLDSWRDSSVPGADEGWLYFLLPLAWSLLISLAFMEDPAAGDSPFWITVPCRWPSLLAAKTAFILVFVQVPYFASCAVILHARGFPPFDNLSTLLYQQLAVSALTLFSLALASVVKNVMQFMMFAILLGTVIATSLLRFPGSGTQPIRQILFFSALAVAALTVAIVQYARQRLAVVCAVSIFALAVAAAIWRLPAEQFDVVQAAMLPNPTVAAPLSIRLSDNPGSLADPQYDYYNSSDARSSGPVIRLAVPIAVSGGANVSIRLRQSSLQLKDAAGSKPARGFLCCGDGLPSWLIVSVNRAIYDRIAKLPLKLRGKVIAEYVRRPAATSVATGAQVPVDGLGQCSTEVTGATLFDQRLQVSCESPRRLPYTSVTLTNPADGMEWRRWIGDGMNSFNYRRVTWLSPVDRARTWFELTDEEHYLEAGRRSLPMEVVSAAVITLAPEFPEASMVFNYEIPNIVLSQFPLNRER